MDGMSISSMSGARQIQGGGRMPAERGPAAIFYAELRNFTGLSEVLDPERVLQLASSFLSVAGAGVKAQDGEVLSLQNDALVGAFRNGKPAQSAMRAILAAQALLRDFGPVGERWQSDYRLPATLSAGVHLGDTIFGMAGPHGREHVGPVPGNLSIHEQRTPSSAGPCNGW